MPGKAITFPEHRSLSASHSIIRSDFWQKNLECAELSPLWFFCLETPPSKTSLRS